MFTFSTIWFQGVERGLAYEEEGYGYVTSQSIPGGTAKGGNTAIKITLSEKYGLAETQEPATASP